MATYNVKLIWIHCNFCYEHFILKRRRFFLLACKHILCENCCKVNLDSRVSTTSYHCTLCNVKARGQEMGNELPPHLKQFFHPQPWLMGSNMKEIITFQKSQQDHFYKHRFQIEREKLEAKLATKVLREGCQTLYLELEKLRTQRKKLEGKVITIKRERALEEERLAQQRHGAYSQKMGNSANSCRARYPTAQFSGNPMNASQNPGQRMPKSTTTNASPNPGLRMPRPSFHNRQNDMTTSFAEPPNYSFQL